MCELALMFLTIYCYWRYKKFARLIFCSTVDIFSLQLMVETNVPCAEETFSVVAICIREEVNFSWNVMAHGDAREWESEGESWRMQWVASTLHTTSEHGVSSITTADAHTSAGQQSTELTPHPPGRFKWTRSFRPKDEIWFLRMCHHISNAVYKVLPGQWDWATCTGWGSEGGTGECSG